jgi:hypothetical protein
MKNYLVYYSAAEEIIWSDRVLVVLAILNSS